MTDREYLWWRFWGRVRHWFGRHNWVPREQWQMVEGGVEIEIIGLICWHCPATKDL